MYSKLRYMQGWLRPEAIQISTKLKLLISLYSFGPLAAIFFTSHGTPVFYRQDFQNVLGLGVAVAIMALLLSHWFILHWLLTGQLQTVKQFCSKIHQGNYAPFPLPNEPRDREDENELTALLREMNWMANQIRVREDRLKETITSLDASRKELKAANVRIEKAMNALWGEMKLARKIQTALVPAQPTLTGFEIAASLRQADEVGGDYYDVLSANGQNWVVIGDVSGHGIPAGLIMMMAQTAIHTALEEAPDISPTQLLALVNKTLTRNISRFGESKYMTVTALNGKGDGTFTFAGLHQDILIYRARTKAVEAVETNGMWLGIMDDIAEVLPTGRMRLEPGDSMMLFTDGITEARDDSGNMFGDEALAEVFREQGDRSASRIHETVMARLKRYDKSDDATLIVMKRAA